MEGKMCDIDPEEFEKYVDRVNVNWRDLFEAMHDLADYLADHGVVPGKEIRKPCDELPLYKGVK
jgi:hypothetical protein